jgi:RNA polymerase sigma-70 factor (ECF subfamily)
MNLVDSYIKKKIQGGDIREFERLFMKYYEPLCHYADNILKDMDSAEDLVQEFFYTVWKNRITFNIKISLNAYFYQSIRNNALHHLESIAIRRNYAKQVFNRFQETISPHLQTEVDFRDLDKAINETLKHMPERCSLIFRMNRFEGRKYHEIAEILSISVKTVEADMGKALQIFRDSLKDYTGEGERMKH